MGNYASKLLLSYTNESQKECIEHQTVVQQTITEDKMCTPILSEKRVLNDPRSISVGIRRTPIEVKCTPVGISKNIPSAIPKYLLKKQYLETDMDAVMPPLMPKKPSILKSRDSDKSESSEENYSTPNANVMKGSKVMTPVDRERFIVLGLDPRSPAADFDRTPILMPKSLALLKARSQENLSRRGSYETDIYNSNNSRREINTSLSIPEIRSLSDTITKSWKTLDTEDQNESRSTSQSDSDLSIFKNQEEITVIKNPKYKDGKKESDELISDEQTVAIDSENETNKQDDRKNIEFNTKVRDDDKIKLWHDSLSSEESVSGKKDKKELPREKIQREDIIITFDNSTTTSTSLKPVKTKGDFRGKEDIKGKKKNTKVDVKLNEEKVFIPENKQGTEVYENRTPLGNRSNNSQMQKQPQQTLRNKTAIRTMMQQENTPPQMYNGKTRNGNQWDPNSTVLI